MKELVVVVQIKQFGEDDQTEEEMLAQIRDTIVSVVSLCDLAVETLTVSGINETD